MVHPIISADRSIFKNRKLSEFVPPCHSRMCDITPLDGYLIHSGVYIRVTRNFQPILYVETYTDFALCLSTSRR